MDIEKALKTIGDWISRETELRKYPKGELLELSESLRKLKVAIARQSVKNEATDHINCCPNCGWRWRERYEPPKGE